MKHYRALISVPVEASSDGDARQQADEAAGAIPDGHVEMLGELREGTLEVSRVVLSEPWFIHQLPADWKA